MSTEAAKPKRKIGRKDGVEKKEFVPPTESSAPVELKIDSPIVPANITSASRSATPPKQVDMPSERIATPSGTVGAPLKQSSVDIDLDVTVVPLSKNAKKKRNKKEKQVPDAQTHKKLGHGSYGSVYRHDDTTAIKVFLVGTGCGAGASLRENELMQKIDHPFIIKHKQLYIGKYKHKDPILEKDTTDGGFHIMMERADSNVYDRIKTGLIAYDRTSPFDIPNIKKVITHMLLPLEYLHFNEIIHRDISVMNVLYCRDQDVYKLCDFGMWRHCNPGDCNRGDYVNIGYRGPEMFTDQSYDYNMDVWPVGMSMYHMLLGHNPCYDADDLAWAEKPYHRAVRLIESIPSCPMSGIEEWVKRMRGISYVDHTPTDEESDAGEIMFLEAYERRKAATEGHWSEIRDEATLKFMSRMLTWHVKTRASPTELLDDPYLQSDSSLAALIKRTREQYLKKNIHFPSTIKSPSKKIREKLSECFNKEITIEKKKIKTLDALKKMNSAREIALAIQLFFECAVGMSVGENEIPVLFSACLVVSVKYNLTNHEADLISTVAIPGISIGKVAAMELDVVKFLDYKIHRRTIADVAASHNDKIEDVESLVILYVKLKEGIHDVDAVYKKCSVSLEENSTQPK